MRILLVSTNQCRQPVTVMPIGACRMADILAREGYEVRLLDLMFVKNSVRVVREAVADFEPDLTGFSIRNVDNGNMADPISYWPSLPEIVQSAGQNPECPTVIGGGAVSVLPEELLRLTGADWAIPGEGEPTVCELARALENGTDPSDVPGIARMDRHGYRGPQNPARPVIDEAVAPDYRRWIEVDRYLVRGAAAPIQTKRGCPRNCLYCTYPLIEGRRHRTSDPVAVRRAVEQYVGDGIRDFEFVDNVFNDPADHALRICRELVGIEAPVRFRTTDLSPRGLTVELLEAMRAAGFVGVGLTVDSASDRVLRGLGKDVCAEDLSRAAEVIHRSDMPCLWIYLLGGPGETTSTVRETLDFAERNLRGEDAAIFFVGIRIFPGTGIERVAREQGVLSFDGNGFLDPVFYVSPDVSRGWMNYEVKRRAREVPGFIAPESQTVPLIPVGYRVAEWLELRRPVWRHTATARRLLSYFGL